MSRHRDAHGGPLALGTFPARRPFPGAVRAAQGLDERCVCSSRWLPTGQPAQEPRDEGGFKCALVPPPTSATDVSAREGRVRQAPVVIDDLQLGENDAADLFSGQTEMIGAGMRRASSPPGLRPGSEHLEAMVLLWSRVRREGPSATLSWRPTGRRKTAVNSQTGPSQRSKRWPGFAPVVRLRRVLPRVPGEARALTPRPRINLILYHGGCWPCASGAGAHARRRCARRSEGSRRAAENGLYLA